MNDLEISRSTVFYHPDNSHDNLPSPFQFIEKSPRKPSMEQDEEYNSDFCEYESVDEDVARQESERKEPPKCKEALETYDEMVESQTVQVDESVHIQVEPPINVDQSVSQSLNQIIVQTKHEQKVSNPILQDSLEVISRSLDKPEIPFTSQMNIQQQEEKPDSESDQELSRSELLVFSMESQQIQETKSRDKFIDEKVTNNGEKFDFDIDVQSLIKMCDQALNGKPFHIEAAQSSKEEQKIQLKKKIYPPQMKQPESMIIPITEKREPSKERHQKMIQTQKPKNEQHRNERGQISDVLSEVKNLCEDLNQLDCSFADAYSKPISKPVAENIKKPALPPKQMPIQEKQKNTSKSRQSSSKKSKSRSSSKENIPINIKPLKNSVNPEDATKLILDRIKSSQNEIKAKISVQPQQQYQGHFITPQQQIQNPIYQSSYTSSSTLSRSNGPILGTAMIMNPPTHQYQYKPNLNNSMYLIENFSLIIKYALTFNLQVPRGNILKFWKSRINFWVPTDNFILRSLSTKRIA